MSTRILLALIGALLIVRLPSLVQPMGPDQGLYAYVGERIRHGELAYRDAWDQKPPGIHYVYAMLRTLSSRDVVVPAADLAAAASVAALLWAIGSRLCGPLAGGLSAVLFLLLSDPALARYGGFRVRAQAETFIALAVTASLALAVGAGGANGASGASGAGARGANGANGALRLVVAGLLLGVAFSLKYNAGLFGLVVLAGLAVGADEPGYLGGARFWREALLVAIGTAIVPAVLLILFWRGGALDDLYQATIVYNLQYSGETYASRWDMIRYVFVGPIRHAQVDPLWFAGGVGCLYMLFVSVRAFVQRRLVTGWIPVLWVGVACVSIAVNGSRALPQYFLQAAPGLGLAAGMAAAIGLPKLPAAARWVVVLVLAVATWRVGVDPFPKLAGNVWHDMQYALGRIDRRTHLAKYGARDVDKYSALDNRDLGDFLASHTRPDETVYVFGYSSGAYVYSDRRSASRFFWSRPVIVGFNAGNPAYGVNGVRSDLERRAPAYVVLQERDWPDTQNSAPFFHAQSPLDDWLRANYHRVDPFVDGFEGWERNLR
jgi:hypothetical protein